MPVPDEGTKKQRGRRLEGLTKHWLPFLTALLVLVTAVVTLYAKTTTDERDDLEASATSLEDQVADLSATNNELSASNDELDQANQDLEEENAELRQADAGSDTTIDPDDGQGATPPTTSGPTQDSTPEVLRETAGSPVVLSAYDGIDLDSLESNWGIEANGRDLYVDYGATTMYVSDILSIVDAPPTPDVCEARTLRDSRLDASETVVGQQLCVRSSEGRWAYVRIAAIDTEAETMSFDIVVWKLPTDP